MKAAATSPKKRKLSRISTATAQFLWAEATVRMEIVHTAEIVVDAADVPAAADVIEDAAGVVEGPVAAGAIEDAAGRAGEDTRASLPRICTDRHG